MFGRKPETPEMVPFGSAPETMRERFTDRFIEFEGALCQADDMGRLEFTPRGKICINVSNIGGYYDHTVLLFGNKVRVMETAAEIGLKLMEVMR